ncbi:MAG TPA: ROK family protein [Chitinophagaceae bacterium]|jgi:glucokinase|nr:ROK family protein [Chitinophagaceae bacterium]
MKQTIVAGVDIGGSHITAALIDLGTGSVLPGSWQRRALNAQGSSAEIIDDWCRAIEDSFASLGLRPERLGIAMPGPFDYAAGISLIRQQAKYNALYGVNVKQLLAARLALGTEHIFFSNDAACFLQGELAGGIARGCRNVLGLTLGTGLGSARSSAGRAEDADLWCAPFRSGIAEDYLSTRWFTGRYTELTGTTVPEVKLLAAAAATDPYAAQVFGEFGAALGTFLLPLVRAEKPELVVLGGNIAQAFPLFSAALHRVLEEGGAPVAVKQTLLGEKAALVGAASYCVPELLPAGATGLVR